MDKFHEFYRALIEARRQLDDGTPPSKVHDKLVSLLNRQESDAVHELGTYGHDLFHRAKYAMAALGDELILRDDPAHGERWMGHLLESALFHSQRAGEKIFDEIDEMQTLGSAANELARVYLAVLGLGFQGAFRPFPNPDQLIEKYRKKLFGIAFGRDPVVTTGRAQLAAAAYASTLTDGEKDELPHLKPWIRALVLLVLVYVLGGAKIWLDATRDFRLDTITNFSSQRSTP